MVKLSHPTHLQAKKAPPHFFCFTGNVSLFLMFDWISAGLPNLILIDRSKPPKKPPPLTGTEKRADSGIRAGSIHVYFGSSKNNSSIGATLGTATTTTPGRKFPFPPRNDSTAVAGANIDPWNREILYSGPAGSKTSEMEGWVIMGRWLFLEVLNHKILRG